MLTANELLSHITQIAFVGLGILSLLDYFRLRGKARRDIALMFASLAVALGLGFVNQLLDEPNPVLGLIAICALIAQPYLLLRLVRYFRPLSPWAQPAAAVAMVASWIALLFAESALSTVLTELMIACFVIVDGYAMFAFIQGALVGSGVVQRRLRAVAVGAGLLALALLAVGVGAVIPRLVDIMTVVLQVTAIGSAVALYLGLATPKWLRRTWQLRELYRYLRLITQENSLETEAEVCEVLSSAALEVSGANKASVLLWHEDSGQWSRYGTHEGESVEFSSELETYRRKQMPAIVTAQVLSPKLRSDLGAEAGELTYIIPLARGQREWGILLVFHRDGSLFPEDDLQMISLLAEQSTILLENLELIEHLRQYAASLEKGTAHLKAVNRELEAFSYSVSHDLRAPLRAVDGFSQALLEDYDDKLDDEGRDFLHRIRSESQRMGQLIDDLISLSRFTRTELTIEHIDLSQMVRDIAANLTQREPERSVLFSIQDGVVACGDERLIRVALENLIGNAWKFTTKKSDARIEFGYTDETSGAEYFVRDNGAGFEMAYVDKLFGAFQRLHAMTEFAGTGIGLATVQRIIHRHGGSIRAEGSVNEGAVFHFKLSEQDCE